MLTRLDPKLAHPMLSLAAVTAAAFLAVSCGDDSSEPATSDDTGAFDPPQVDCTPGESLGCQCTDGRAGQQVCAPNGNELGSCVCGSGPVPDDSGGETEGDTDADTDADPTGAPGLCGNGVVDDDEQCDDGNTRYDDACSNECIAECGVTWEVRIGRPDAGSFGEGIAVGPDNSAALTYVQAGDDQDTLMLARYDAEGTELWSQPLTGARTNVASSVAVDADGNILVVGTTLDDRDIWVGMFDADGRALWADTHDGAEAGDDFGTGAAFDDDGNAIVTGTVRDADGDTDLWLRKYDSRGALWTETYGGVGNGTFSLDDGGAVATDAAGNIYVQADVYVDFDHRDVHLLKYGPDGGAPAWDFAPFEGGAAEVHLGAGLDVDADGSVVMGFNNDAVASGWRFWLNKVDTDGNEVWRLDAEGAGFGLAYLLDGLGVADNGDIGLVLTHAPEMADLQAVVATLTGDGDAGCNSTTAVELGAVIPFAAAVAPSGQIYTTGLLSENGMTQVPWLARFRGAASTR